MYSMDLPACDPLTHNLGMYKCFDVYLLYYKQSRILLSLLFEFVVFVTKIYQAISSDSNLGIWHISANLTSSIAAEI